MIFIPSELKIMHTRYCGLKNIKKATSYRDSHEDLFSLENWVSYPALAFSNSLIILCEIQIFIELNTEGWPGVILLAYSDEIEILNSEKLYIHGIKNHKSISARIL